MGTPTVTAPPRANDQERERRAFVIRPRVRLGRGVKLSDAADTGRGLNNFDLLRLFAAASVVLAHSFDLLQLRQPPSPLEGVGWGQMGVLIFFAISGFLVMRSWSTDPRIISFIVKRSLRLMPGLVVALLLTALVLGPIVTTEPLRVYLRDPATKAYVLNNATMQSNFVLPGVFAHNAYPLAVNGSLWTLPLEVKAYVMVAAIGVLALVTRIKRTVILVPIALFVTLASITGVRPSIPGADHFVAWLVDVQMSPSEVYAAKQGQFTPYVELVAAFAIGAALYSVRSWVRLRWEFAATAVAALIVVRAFAGQVPELAATVLVPYITLCVAYLTAGMFRLPRRFGDYSYGIYIYAFPVQQTISFALAPRSGWVMFAVALPVTCVLAALSWHLVERPALYLKSRLTGADPARAPNEVDAPLQQVAPTGD